MNDGAPAIVDQIVAYESGMLSDVDTIALFQRLVDTGLAWKLQGSYGRMAARLIHDGVVTDWHQRDHATDHGEHRANDEGEFG